MSAETGPPFIVRWIRRAALLLVVVVVTAGIVYLARVPLLVWTGRLLLHDDPVEVSDAIDVLGGGSLARELAAVDLYREGYAPTVVLTLAAARPIAAELGRRGLSVKSEAEARVEFVVEGGVPLEAVTVLSRPVTSTHGEVALLAEWAESRDLERLIVVTSGYHSARTRLVVDRVFGDQPIELLVHAAPVTDFSPEDWWRRRMVLRDVIFELQKLVYYRVMYALGRSA